MLKEVKEALALWNQRNKSLCD